MPAHRQYLAFMMKFMCDHMSKQFKRFNILFMSVYFNSDLLEHEILMAFQELKYRRIYSYKSNLKL